MIYDPKNKNRVEFINPFANLHTAFSKASASFDDLRDAMARSQIKEDEEQIRTATQNIVRRCPEITGLPDSAYKQNRARLQKACMIPKAVAQTPLCYPREGTLSNEQLLAYVYRARVLKLRPVVLVFESESMAHNVLIRLVTLESHYAKRGTVIPLVDRVYCMLTPKGIIKLYSGNGPYEINSTMFQRIEIHVPLQASQHSNPQMLSDSFEGMHTYSVMLPVSIPVIFLKGNTD